MRIGDSVIVGVVLGVAFGVWNLAATWLAPLVDDTLVALLIFYGPMFTAWGVAGFLATRRTGRVVGGIKIGAAVAFVTFAVFALANLVRVNLFLETIRDRPDWRYMMVRFQASGFDSLRAFVNYDFVTGVPLKIFMASMIGACTGLIGGLTALVVRREPRGRPPHSRQLIRSIAVQDAD